MKNELKGSLNGQGNSIMDAIDNGLLIDIMPHAYAEPIEAAMKELGTNSLVEAISYLKGE